MTHLVTHLVTWLVDLVRLTRLKFGTLTFIEFTGKSPSTGFDVLFTFISNTLEMVCLLAGGTKHPFAPVNTISENDKVISQKLLLNVDLILSLFITYVALPTKAGTSIAMVIRVQFNWFTCHSKITNKPVEAGHLSSGSTFQSPISGHPQGVWGNLSHTIQFRHLATFSNEKEMEYDTVNSDPNLAKKVTQTWCCS